METAPVQAAMAFEQQGIPASLWPRPTPSTHASSHPPTNRFADSWRGLIRWPSVPITANVDGTFYPMKGEASKPAILEKLATQMASSVEWGLGQIETMYDARPRSVEVAPRAPTMFAMQILEDRPHVPVMTNHPKQGGIASFHLRHWCAGPRRPSSAVAGVGFRRLARRVQGGSDRSLASQPL